MPGLVLIAAVLSFSEPVDNFDLGPPRGARACNFFGPMGAWSDGASHADWVLLPDPVAGGRFLRLTFQAAEGTAGCGLYFLLGPQDNDLSPTLGARDLRHYSALCLRLRGQVPEGQTALLELTDADGRNVRAPLPRAATSWAEASVSLDAFAPIDLSRVTKIALVLPPCGAASQGRLDLDDLALTCAEPEPISDDALLDLMERRAWEFFRDGFHPVTGLVWDKASTPHISSIAATGFGLAALPVAARRGWLLPENAVSLARRCLSTLIAAPQSEAHDAAGAHGFFYHFLDARTGRRAGQCEVSSIDTALLIAGALTCGEGLAEFPGGAEIRDMATSLAAAVEWPWMLDASRKVFWMGWQPERGFFGSWDYYTDEALLISLLAVGSPTHPVAPDVAWAWKRERGSYGGQNLIQTYCGTIFSYLFCSLFVDLRGRTDRHPTHPVDWWANARAAALANLAFCRDQAQEFVTYRNGRFGLSACLAPGEATWQERYDGDYGAPPAAVSPHHDGTLAPYGAAMCLPLFVGEENPALTALWSFWRDCRRLWGMYGFHDGCNLS
ncbi:MAG: hypothetical protein N2512_11580, partial [Armatimonadetes bacterium]|nr:hypothetical protein [Armatimonadota bacterium]